MYLPAHLVSDSFFFYFFVQCFAIAMDWVRYVSVGGNKKESFPSFTTFNLVSCLFHFVLGDLHFTSPSSFASSFISSFISFLSIHISYLSFSLLPTSLLVSFILLPSIAITNTSQSLITYLTTLPLASLCLHSRAYITTLIHNSRR